MSVMQSLSVSAYMVLALALVLPARIPAQAQHCSNSSHVGCPTGECIPRYRLCDGTPDCGDESDETLLCRGWTSTCPLPAFHCTYGACVPGSKRCDGHIDCADGSDEHNCHNTLQKPSPSSTNTSCSGDEHTCGDGTCLEYRQTCDGTPHCSDGTDETSFLCFSRPACPGAALRCAYGACVHVHSRCNGLRDCADGSDERDCATETVHCALPTERPPHSRVTQLPGPYLEYTCEPGYRMQGTKSVHGCEKGKWKPPLPKYNLCRRARRRQFFVDLRDLVGNTNNYYTHNRNYYT